MTEHESERNPWDALRLAVHRQVDFLQNETLHNSTGRQSLAKKTLAELRRAAMHPAGSSPAVWETTIAVVPPDLQGHKDEPNAVETSTHLALTTFAFHQQSRTEPMHRQGVDFGSSIGRLSKSEARSEAAVWRRFSAMLTANGVGEIQNHLRSLAQLLRAAKVPTDYSQLCMDLIALQSNDRAAGVRLRWGRSYNAARYTPTSDRPTELAQ